MGLVHGSGKFDRYDMSDEFSLLKANKDAWEVFYAIYYNAKYHSFNQEMLYNISLDRETYWIYQGEHRIGGVVMGPNLMYLLYFIPPFQQQSKVVLLLKNVLMQWSDLSSPIHVYEILPDQVDLFARAGFWPDAYRHRWMQRPTEVMETDWEKTLIVTDAVVQDRQGTRGLVHDKEIGHLFFRCMSNGVSVMERKQVPLSHYISNVQLLAEQTNDIALKASTLVYDKRNKALIAACLISVQGHSPNIYNIGVLPSYSKRGIGTNMLTRALTVLHDHYPVLRVYVLQGNPVESVCYHMGFMPGPLLIRRMTLSME
ncbi:ribosomal protein S18 acetylase RimI-like enzyme [Paenibacillus sp. DS2015]|uniref:GNAT family N-acetyltransferase n=1 Tax=Paenibacillus sp. DS2015 TaxID=3373917 RepID=UPI003D1CB76C